MTRFYFKDAKPATYHERDLATLRYDRALATRLFPADLLLHALKQQPGIEFVESREFMDAPNRHSVVIDKLERPDFNQRAFIREIERRLELVAQTQLGIERREQELQQRAELRRKSRLGGGNSRQRRVRLRAALRRIDP